MEAGSNLRQAIESTYTFLEGLTAFLESIENKRMPDERLQTLKLRDLAARCRHKPIGAFPELHGWLAELTRGGLRWAKPIV